MYECIPIKVSPSQVRSDSEIYISSSSHFINLKISIGLNNNVIVELAGGLCGMLHI